MSTQAEQNSAGPRSVTASEKEITLGPKAAKTFDFQVTLPDENVKYILKLMQNQTIIDEESLDLNITSAEMPVNPKFNYPEITGDLVFSSSGTIREYASSSVKGGKPSLSKSTPEFLSIRANREI